MHKFGNIYLLPDLNINNCHLRGMNLKNNLHFNFSNEAP